MLVRDFTWEAIRAQFSEEEKVELRAAMCGQAICPRGVILDEDEVNAILRDKLASAVDKFQRASRP